MPLRLKSRSIHPPRGWEFVQPPSGWRIPNPLNVNFEEAVKQIIKHREANPGYNLSIVADKVADDLEAYTVHRLKGDPRSAHLLKDDEDKKKLSPVPTPNIPLSNPRQPNPIRRALESAKKSVEHAVNRLKQDARAARILAEWVGAGQRPVETTVAQDRSQICKNCPENKVPRGTAEAALASAILEQTRLKTGLGLRVEGESELKSCDICGCHLPLKVWVPFEHLDTEGFPPHCWITKESKQSEKQTVTVQRKGAIGDNISASIVADKLKAKGYRVRWAAVPQCIPALKHHPSIDEFCEPDSCKIDICLDGAYERHREIKTTRFSEIFLEVASKAIGTLPKTNCVPTVIVTDEERSTALETLNPHPRPWVMIIPRSNSWPNRTVVQEEWNILAGLVVGTCFWTGTDPCSKPLVDLECRDFRVLMGYLAHADLVVSVDTGPMHAAAALNRSMIVIEQAFDPALHLSDQNDFVTFKLGLPCSPCFNFTCKLKYENPKDPSCRHVDTSALADAVNARIHRPTVSAIIPVYGDNRERLARCLSAIHGHVEEIVVVMDGNSLTFQADDVVSVPSTGKRIGYGKTCNRGARHSTGEWLLMLNNDCYLDAAAVGHMLACADEDVAVVGCLLRYPDGTIQHGGTMRPKGHVGFGHRDWKKREATIRQPCDMEFVTFAAALVRREAFYEIRGFDEDYDCYSEDTDFCMRVRRAGWRVRYTPHAHGIHDESQSSSAIKGQLIQHGNEVFARKWRKWFEENPTPEGMRP